LATSTVATFLKYLLYIGDMVMEGQWENKAVYIFYLELVRDLLHLSLYLFFFLVIFINYGLPLHLVRELYETFRNFKARVADITMKLPKGKRLEPVLFPGNQAHVPQGSRVLHLPVDGPTSV
jgi:hypothetical protein